MATALTRWGLMLGLATATVSGNMALPTVPAAIALTEEEVIEKLQPVPMYAIVNAQGVPLPASHNQTQETLIPMFVSQETAERKLAELRTASPEIADQVQVRPVSLAEVYKLQVQNADRPEAPSFAYIPTDEQVQSALTILRQRGEEVESFPGVPMFVARGGEEQGLLTIERDGQQIVPIFFEKEQVDNIVERFREQAPDLVSTVNIDVVPLQDLIATLRDSEDQELDRLVIVPTRASLQMLRERAGN